MLDFIATFSPPGNSERFFRTVAGLGHDYGHYGNARYTITRRCNSNHVSGLYLTYFCPVAGLGHDCGHSANVLNMHVHRLLFRAPHLHDWPALHAAFARMMLAAGNFASYPMC